MQSLKLHLKTALFASAVALVLLVASLLVVRQILQEHEAEITFESEQDKGTTVSCQ